jgi:hypothetical protein
MREMPARAAVLSLVGFACCLAVSFAAAGARAQQREAAIVIDSWYTGDAAERVCDFARSFVDAAANRIRNSGCEVVSGCPEMTAVLSVCRSVADPKMLAEQFEQRLLMQFATSPECQGVSVARYGTKDRKPSAAEQTIIGRPHWDLGIEFNPGSRAQAWSLEYLDGGKPFERESVSEAAMARDICAIVLGQRRIPSR